MNMAEAAHQRIDRRTAASLCGVLLQPLSKGCIQSLMLRSGHQPCLFDEAFVSA